MYWAFAVKKYLHEKNFEHTDNFKLINIDGKVIIHEWGYDIDPPDISNIDHDHIRFEFALAHIRKIRNDVLDMTDKYLLRDSPISQSSSNRVLIPYRQALRDVPNGIKSGSLPKPDVNDEDMRIINLADIFPVIPNISGNYLIPIQARYRWMRLSG